MRAGEEVAEVDPPVLDERLLRGRVLLLCTARGCFMGFHILLDAVYIIRHKISGTDTHLVKIHQELVN